MSKLSSKNATKKPNAFFIGVVFLLLAAVLAINVGYLCRAFTYIPMYLFGVGSYAIYLFILAIGIVYIFGRSLHKVKHASRILGALVAFVGLLTLLSLVQLGETPLANFKSYFSGNYLYQESYFKIKFIDVFSTYKIGGGFVGSLLCSIFVKASKGFTVFVSVLLMLSGLVVIFLPEIKRTYKNIKQIKQDKIAKEKEMFSRTNDDTFVLESKATNKDISSRDLNRQRIIDASQTYVPNNLKAEQIQESTIVSNDDFSDNLDTQSRFDDDSSFDVPIGSLEVARFINNEDKITDSQNSKNKINNNSLDVAERQYGDNYFEKNNKEELPERPQINNAKPAVAVLDDTKSSDKANANEQHMIDHLSNGTTVEQLTIDFDAPADEVPEESKKEERKLNLDIFTKPAAEVKKEPEQPQFIWVPPSLNLLDEVNLEEDNTVNIEAANEKMAIINNFFDSRGINTHITRYKIGPKVTRFYVPYNDTISVKTINSAIPDIEVRINSSVIFTQCVDVSQSGIDVPNKKNTIVPFRSVFEKLPDVKKHPLSIPFGMSIDGELICDDFNKFPHLLLAGSTNSGKSNYIHSVLCTLLMRASPEILKIAIIDPKFIEFIRYKDVPHLLCPIVTEAEKGVSLLEKLVEEMDNRYRAFAQVMDGCTSLEEFNNYRKSIDKPILPYIICIIDEYANLVDNAQKAEIPVNTLAAKARACGIFLFLATQRPSANVVNGTIKSNVPVHLALKTSNSVDSTVILGCGGAERLLGYGDMLIQDPGLPTGADLIRCQAAFISDNERSHILGYLREHYKAQYDQFFLNLDETKAEPVEENDTGERDLSYLDDDPKFRAVLKYAGLQDYFSESKITHNFGMGTFKAGTFIVRMIQIGALDSELVSNKGRKVNKEWYEQQRTKELENAPSVGSSELTSFEHKY